VRPDWPLKWPAIPAIRQIRLRRVSAVAKCGISFRYPVKIVIVREDGSNEAGPVIGEAETLREALEMAERQGFDVRDANDGGTGKFVAVGEGGPAYFVVAVYPA
jgi:hypothetical protein